MDVIKAHGTGNDFVVVVDLDDELDVPPELVRALCDRRTGIGADGLIRIGSGTDGADAFMDYRNADGSVVEMCGNGVRVVAKVLADGGHVASTVDTIAIATRAGTRSVEVVRGRGGEVTEVTVDMGPPIQDAPRIPVDLPNARGFHLDVAPDVEWTAVSMGNPHAVTLVDDLALAPVATLGPRVERHARFPRGTNVEFAHVVDPSTVDLRVWERGVGETQACGTGACATLVVLRAAGHVGDAADVRLPGGTLKVRYRPGDHPSVFMTGPAEVVASGTLAPAWLASRVPSQAGHTA